MRWRHSFPTFRSPVARGDARKQFDLRSEWQTVIGYDDDGVGACGRKVREVR